jgi:hypothetical protein
LLPARLEARRWARFFCSRPDQQHRQLTPAIPDRSNPTKIFSEA